MDQSDSRGRELGALMGLGLPQQHFEQAATSNWGGLPPTTTGAQTSTISTYTSTTVASSAVGGPAYALYARGSPIVGLTSVRPAGQVCSSTCRA